MKIQKSVLNGHEYFVDGTEVWYPAMEKISLSDFAERISRNTARMIDGRIWVKSASGWPVKPRG